MTICDSPCAFNTPLHQTSFPANAKSGFHVLEFTISEGIFFKSKTLWKFRFLVELHLLWRLQLPVATVNFLPFWWFSRKIINYFKSSNKTCLPRGCSKPSKTLSKKIKNVNRAKEQLPVWLIPLSINALTPSTMEGSQQMSEELGLKNKKRKLPHIERKIQKSIRQK